MEADINLLIAAGIGAIGGIAIGLIIGIVRGQTAQDRLRGELTGINDQARMKLAKAHAHIRGLSVGQEQARAQLRDKLSQLASTKNA